MAEETPPSGDWQRRWPPVSYWAKAAAAVAVTLGVLVAARSVSNILIMVVIAIVFAVGLDPAVRFLERFGIRRGVAVAAIFLAVLLFIALFAWLIGPPLVKQISGLARDIPGYLDRLARRNDSIGRYFREHDLAQKLKGFIADIPSNVAQSFNTILGVAGRVGSVLFNLVTVAILTIYFMLSLPSMRRTAAILFSPSRREQGERVINRSIAKIGGYVSGNLLTSGICAVLALVALLVLRVPFAVPLALWAGIADLIPQVGSYLGAAPAVIVGLFASPLIGLIVLAYFIVYQQFENYLLVPRVMKNAVDLSPAAVIISTLIAGSLLGFVGALLALPVAATVKVIIYDVWLVDRVRRGDEEARAQLEAQAEAEAAEEAAREQRKARRGLLARRRGGPRRPPEAPPGPATAQPTSGSPEGSDG